MDWFKNFTGDTLGRLERYFNATAIFQGIITGVVVLIAVNSLFKRK